LPGSKNDTRLPSQQRERLFRGFQAASALLMMHQLAGKAARDGYFLTVFQPADLPQMVAGAAAFAVLASYLATRLFTWRSPARMLPSLFLASGILQIGEWMLLPVQPRIGSVLVYLHTFGLGAVLMSGFWSTLSEEFDPREAKRKIGRIAAAGTAGGLAGGLLAERLAAWFQPNSVMLLLAGAHVACGMVLLSLTGSSSAKEPRKRPQAREATAEPTEERRYLRMLAALVVLSAVAASLLDFAFKFSATAHFGKGAALLRFFAVFYTGSALLTFLLQSLAANKSLERFGLGKTMGVLPVTATAGSLLSLAFPGAWMLTAARGAEAGVRNSLFKSGYEVCFTPLAAEKKRRVKTVVDVGAERAGDFTGSLLAKLALRVAAVQPLPWILAGAAALAGGALALVTLADRAYVKALARSLMHRAAELDLSQSIDLTTRTVISRANLASAGMPAAPAAEGTADLADFGSDVALRQLAQLRSPDVHPARTAMATADVTEPLVAAQLIQLLGSRELGEEALARLKPAAERWAGLLCDCLANPSQDFQVRRKIPGLLGLVPSQRAVDGLMAGVRDERFEVRAQCSRALLRLKRARPELRPSRELALAAVERELAEGMLFGEGRRAVERESESFDTEGLEEFLKERSNAGLQHVFCLLALEYPEGPLLMAFRALEAQDRHLRATALEYLDTILPDKTQQLLWQVVGEHPPAAARQTQEVLDDLMKASATVMIRLKKPV
jgi:hypothetical protein